MRMHRVKVALERLETDPGSYSNFKVGMALEAILQEGESLYEAEQSLHREASAYIERVLSARRKRLEREKEIARLEAEQRYGPRDSWEVPF